MRKEKKIADSSRKGLPLRSVAILLFLMALPGMRGSDREDPPLGPPLDGPLHLTGTMGEFRPAQFHYGVDLSTGGRTGLPVYAAADGSISRLMYDRYTIGYGLWITHRDGRVTKYGHLKAFSRRILDSSIFSSLKEKVLLREEFDFNAKKGKFPVLRGEVVAISGETGSGFPHLHFELLDRDTILNPLRHGLLVKDDQAPLIRSISLEPVSPESRINGRHESLEISLRKGSETKEASGRRIVAFAPARSIPVAVSGRIAVKIDSYDPSGRSRLGLDHGSMAVDGKTIFRFHFDVLPHLPPFRHLYLYDLMHSGIFYHVRYEYHYGFPGGSPLDLMKESQEGVVDFSGPEATKHSVRIVAADASNNQAVATLLLSRDAHIYPPVDGDPPNVVPGKETVLQGEEGLFSVRFSKNSVARGARFQVSGSGNRLRLPPGLKQISNLQILQPDIREFLEPFLVEWKSPQDPKQGVYYLESPLSYPVYAGSDWKDGSYHVPWRRTGFFVILEDRSVPRWRKNRKRIFAGDFRLFLRVSDTGTGINMDSLRVKVDGIDCRAELDPDRGRIEVFYPEVIRARGKHLLQATIQDMAGNQSEDYIFSYRVL